MILPTHRYTKSLSAMLALCCLLLPAGLTWASGKSLLWGDTHVHTAYSTDSFLNGNTTAGPDAAYRYAKGLPVVHPGTGARIQIGTPLDFLVVADHAESYGAVKRANEDGLPRQNLGLVDRLHSWVVEKFFRFMAGNPDSLMQLLAFASPDTNNVQEAAKNPASITIPNSELIAAETWRASTEVTDSHNLPGQFTALIGWEWSSIPAGANLHRVVFTNGDAVAAQQFIPFSSSVSSYPEDLWQWLAQTSNDVGVDFVAIPHNSNISRGYMFPAARRLRDTPIDKSWLQQRARWEPVVEATQFKGDSETDPSVSPEDPFAEFETYPYYISPTPIPWAPGRADFVRSALRTGLALERDFGVNPYRFGLIGSTDSHTALASAEEPNFWGKFLTDTIPAQKTRSTGEIENFGWAMSASGLAAVWAEDNSREAIFQAFKRREVYATTGPRIRVRVYAGTDFSPGDELASDLGKVSSSAVPMGGELRGLQEAPTLLVQANKDPKSAHLDRIQVVKGWLQGDQTFERVYDIAWSGERVLDTDGHLEEVPDSVDPTTAAWSNEHGAPMLAARWTDPEFDPTQLAFYYVRILEVPTPRHSTLDSVALGIPADTTGQPVSIQERAYTSPIHYRP